MSNQELTTLLKKLDQQLFETISTVQQIINQCPDGSTSMLEECYTNKTNQLYRMVKNWAGV